MAGGLPVLGALVILACTGFSAAVSPTFLWSNTEGVASSQVSYEVVQGSDVILSTLLSASKPAAGNTAPQHIVAYFGNKADAAFFRRTGSPAGPLQSSLEASSSWMVYQYTNFQEDSEATIAKHLRKDNVEFQSIGCDKGSAADDAVESVKGFLDVEDGPRVLLVCGHAADAAAEVADVMSLQKLLASSGKQYLSLYATGAGLVQQARQRVLVQAAPLVCDALCKSQVAWLQGILAAGTLMIALLSGLSCTYLLEGPTKFEAPKDAAAS